MSDTATIDSPPPRTTTPPDHRLPSPQTATVQPTAKTPFYKKPVVVIFLIVLLVLAIIGSIFYLHGRHYEATDDAYVESHVVPLAPQVSARVLKVYVDDNTYVHQGDLLVELDPTDFQAALDQARASEAASAGKALQANAQITSAQSQVAQAQAALDVQQVNLDNAQRDLQRYQGLDERAKSQQSQDNATDAQRTAAAQVANARASLEATKSQVASAQAFAAAAAGDLKRAQADTHRAEINLGYCRITAPMDGYVTNKNVDPGQYLMAASPMFAMVSPDVWIVANFKETQLASMKVGQEVSISVDAYPDLAMKGKVESLQSGTGARFSVIPAENATGNFVKVVQRVPTKIVFDKLPDDFKQKLSPGMSVEVSVHVIEGEF